MTTQLVSAAHISRLEAEDKLTFCTDCSLRLSFFFLFLLLFVCFVFLLLLLFFIDFFFTVICFYHNIYVFILKYNFYFLFATSFTSHSEANIQLFISFLFLNCRVRLSHF